MCSIPIEKGATFGKMTVLLESKMFKCMQHSPEIECIPAVLTHHSKVYKNVSLEGK